MINKSISVVFPAYNEQDNILKTLKLSTKFLAINFKEWEIVVVNDGSKDNTKQVVEEFKKSEKRVRVVNHPTNYGYGAAVWDGIKAAKKDIVFVADSDGQFDIRELTGFVKEIGDYDAVLGFRKRRSEGLVRKANMIGWKIAVFLTLGLRVKDIDCAFKLFKRSVVQKIEIRSLGATFSAELLYKMKKGNCRMKELPVTHLPRTKGRATGANLKVILRAIKELVKLSFSK
jgi:glycosyltransferase involved in cell wall biosynthesis